MPYQQSNLMNTNLNHNTDIKIQVISPLFVLILGYLGHVRPKIYSNFTKFQELYNISLIKLHSLSIKTYFDAFLVLLLRC